jgi:undecaprenyl pyrophosphate synthase
MNSNRNALAKINSQMDLLQNRFNRMQEEITGLLEWSVDPAVEDRIIALQTISARLLGRLDRLCEERVRLTWEAAAA